MATVYDRISRALLRRYPELFQWLLGLPATSFRFVHWLDAHLGSPEAPERTADALAHLTTPADGGRPWAVLVEFQTDPDAEMFGRVLEYLGGAWRREKPTELPGDRFAVAAVVVNLTGKGNSFPTAAWPEAGFTSGLPGRDVNLSLIDAGGLREGVARGDAPAVLLAWIPLMKRGEEAGIMQRWLEVAGQMADARLRADLGLAAVFAEAADRGPAWKQALKGWIMTESTIIREIEDKARAEGIQQGQARLLLGVLEDRFGALPEDLSALIQSQRDLVAFRQWMALAWAAESLDGFRKAAKL